MPELEYPKDREAYFAMRVARLLVKCAAANEIGADAAMLVTVIACTEDSRRYKSPVTFFNEQLMPLVGVKKWETLDRMRRKAVEAGWLVYIPPPEGSKRAGKYWTTIPKEHEDRADTPADEGDEPVVAALSVPPKRISTVVSTPDTTPKTDIVGGTEGGIVGGTEGGNYLPIPKPEYKEIEQGDSTFIPVEAFTRNLAVTGIQIKGNLVEYYENPAAWEAEFIRRWNQCKGVIRRAEPIDQPLRAKLQRRLCDDGWFWERAMSMFPLTTEMTFPQNLSWFLKPETVSAILDKTYHPEERRTKGKKHDRQVSNPGQVYSEAVGQPAPPPGRRW